MAIAQTLRMKVGRLLSAEVEETKRAIVVGMRKDEKTVTINNILRDGTMATTGTDSSPPGITSISQINFFLSLVNAKRVLFSPLVIVGFQIFERPSGGRYGGRWISDGYFKSNIW